jgi:carboxymethylenebutenolidase
MKSLKEIARSRGRSAGGLKLFARIAVLTCSFAVASLVWSPNARAAALEPNAAPPQAMGDVNAQMVQYMSGAASISAYLAKPKGEGKHAAVLLVHDVDGVNDSLQEVARRFAGAGFVAFAPNLVSRNAAAKTSQQIFSAIGQLPLLQPVSDLKAAFAFLQQDPSVDATKISVVAFGWGGWRAFKLLEDSPSAYRAVIFYGTTPADDYGLTNIHTPILAEYAQFDFRVTGNALWTKKQLGSNFKFDVYPGADRGFLMPDPNPPYGFPGAGPEAAANDAAAKQSWTKTLEFLNSPGA